jgi:hypothetical protein
MERQQPQIMVEQVEQAEVVVVAVVVEGLDQPLQQQEPLEALEPF